jgi:hypothetical protein
LITSTASIRSSSILSRAWHYSNNFPLGIKLFWQLLTSPHHTWYISKTIKMNYRVNLPCPSLTEQQSRSIKTVSYNIIFYEQYIQLI